jgi:biotin carboxyl carrier protein
MSNLRVTIDNTTYDIEVDLRRRAGADVTVVVNGEPLTVTLPDVDDPAHLEWIMVMGQPCEFIVDPQLHWIRSAQGLHHLEIHPRETTVTRPRSGDGRVKAPIPGYVSRVLVEPGALVEAGQPLLVLEAMKMENQIYAPRSGSISQLNVVAGQNVALHALLAEIV